MIVHPIFVKVMVHPALHIVTTDRSECKARLGMMQAAQAPGGNNGMSRVNLCVERTRSPFGRRATMGMAVGNMFVAGASVVRKWLVAPESRMAHHLMVLALISIVLRRIEAARA
jgi:hypothetical protein